MEAQSAHGRDTVGRRIRFLRGSMSQAEFAEKAGVSRSAIANYETGRTNPGRDVLTKIAHAFEVSPELLISGDVRDVEELTAALGFGPDTEDSLTADEWAIVRILRLMNTNVVAEAVRLFLETLTRDEEAKRLADPRTIEVDVARLIMILELDGEYQRGISQGNVKSLVAELARRLEGMKGGPQSDSTQEKSKT